MLDNVLIVYDVSIVMTITALPNFGTYTHNYPGDLYTNAGLFTYVRYPVWENVEL